MPVSMAHIATLYRDLGLPPPAGEMLAADDVPPPHRALLVHSRGMTRTLEEAYGESLTLRVVKSVGCAHLLTRHVQLVLGISGTIVASALARIHLHRFPREARDLIVEQSLPLGTILRRVPLDHRYHGQGYFALTADTALSLSTPATNASPAYGRCIAIVNADGEDLAETLEVTVPTSHPAPPPRPQRSVTPTGLVESAVGTDGARHRRTTRG